MLKTNQKQTRIKQNFEIQKPSLIQESSETSESSEGSQTDALVSSKPKKKLHLEEGAAINPTKLEKAIKTKKRLRKNRTHLQKLLQKDCQSFSFQNPKSKKAIDTSELNEKAEKASIKKSDADSSSESEKDSKKEEVPSATPKAPEKKRTRKNLHQKLLKRLRSNLVVMMFHLRQRKTSTLTFQKRKNPPLQKVQMKHKMM